jgi:hypothetical protein
VPAGSTIARSIGARDEREWWRAAGIDPIPVGCKMPQGWGQRTEPDRVPKAAVAHQLQTGREAVVSELRRPQPDRKVVAFIATQPLELIYVSAVTLAEIRFGIEIVTDATK